MKMIYQIKVHAFCALLGTRNNSWEFHLAAVRWEQRTGICITIIPVVPGKSFASFNLSTFLLTFLPCVCRPLFVTFWCIGKFSVCKDYTFHLTVVFFFYFVHGNTSMSIKTSGALCSSLSFLKTNTYPPRFFQEKSDAYVAKVHIQKLTHLGHLMSQHSSWSSNQVLNPSN